MEIKNIRNKLSRYCDFASAWNHMAPGENLSSATYPLSEMGYFRCDHDGSQWWRNPCSVRKALFTPDRGKELDAVADALTTEFPTLAALEDFCVINAEDLRNGYEYNLYLSGEQCNYWIRVNTTPKDYNLYIHAIVKEVGITNN